MKLYIDCDPGIDDFFALVYLLTRSDVDIVGIGSVAGNVSIDKVDRNLRFAVSLLRPNVKIFKGPGTFIIENDDKSNPKHAEHYHGTDGLGNFWTSDYYKGKSTDIEKIIEKCNFSDKSVVWELINLSHEYNGELVILALGPLTNIALALLIDPLFSSRIKQIYIMGGSFNGIGNSRDYIGSEFNFSMDPESVQIVLNRMTCPKTVYTIDTVGNPYFEKKFLANWSKNEIIFNCLSNCFNHLFSKNEKLVFYDLILAVIVMHPETVKKSSSYGVLIELGGHCSRGNMKVDFGNFHSGKKDQIKHSYQQFSTVSLIEELDERKILEIISKL